jgi:hypothetical protein
MQNLLGALNGAIDWTVEHIGSGDPTITALVLLAAIAAAHAGNHLTGFIIDEWSKRKV